MSFFEMFMIPTAEELDNDFSSLDRDLSDFHKPLQMIVEQVAGPSIRTNFDVGGRPSWEPLADGSGRSPLIRTGALRASASSPESWTVGDQEARFNLQVGYGIYHDQGTHDIPARPFAMLQDEDIEKAERIIDAWLAEKTAENGFGGGSSAGGFFVSF